MPVIKSAIKKLRKDINRTKRNDIFRDSLKRAIQKAKKEKSAKAVAAAVSFVDRAVKKNIIHANRAARIKSSLAKGAKTAGRTAPKKTVAKRAKPSAKTTKK